MFTGSRNAIRLTRQSVTIRSLPSNKDKQRACAVSRLLLDLTTNARVGTLDAESSAIPAIRWISGWAADEPRAAGARSLKAAAAAHRFFFSIRRNSSSTGCQGPNDSQQHHSSHAPSPSAARARRAASSTPAARRARIQPVSNASVLKLAVAKARDRGCRSPVHRSRRRSFATWARR